MYGSLRQFHSICNLTLDFSRVEELQHTLHCLHCKLLNLHLALLLVHVVVVGGEHLVKKGGPGGQDGLVAEEGLSRALQHHIRVLRVDQQSAELRCKKRRTSDCLRVLSLLVGFGHYGLIGVRTKIFEHVSSSLTTCCTLRHTSPASYKTLNYLRRDGLIQGTFLTGHTLTFLWTAPD